MITLLTSPTFSVLGIRAIPVNSASMFKTYCAQRASLFFTLLFTFSIVPSVNANCVKPHTMAMSTNTIQNIYRGGQKTDLIFQVNTITVETSDCPMPSTPILERIKLPIVIDWESTNGYMGTQGSKQYEHEPGDAPPDDIADYMTIRWRDINYQLFSLTRNGQNIIGGEGELVITDPKWDAVKIVPPAGFEKANPAPLEYELTLTYLNPQADCRVRGLNYLGHYMHSYDADYHFLATTGVLIELSYPWDYKAGIQIAVDGTDDHCWDKYLLGSNQNVILEWLPPANLIPDATCCNQAVSLDRVKPSRDSFSVPSSVTRGGSLNADVSASDADSGVSAIYMRAEGDNGEVLAEETETFSPSCPSGCIGALASTVPNNYSGSLINVLAEIIDDQGNVFASKQSVVINNPLRGPILTSQTVSDGALCSDTLSVQIQEETAGVNAAQVASRLSYQVIKEDGTVIDSDANLPVADLGGLLFSSNLTLTQLLPGQTPVFSDAILHTGNDYWIEARYADDDSPESATTIPIRCDEQAIAEFGGEQASGIGTVVFGTAIGGQFSFEVNGMLVSVNTVAGEPAAQVADNWVSALNLASIPGVSASRISPYGIHLVGADRVAKMDVDPGLFLLSSGLLGIAVPIGGAALVIMSVVLVVIARVVRRYSHR